MVFKKIHKRQHDDEEGVCNGRRPSPLTAQGFILLTLITALLLYTARTAVFLKYIGNYGEGAGQFRTPLDVAIDKDNKLFVSNHNNGRIEIIGIDSYSQLNINPNTINLSVLKTARRLRRP